MDWTKILESAWVLLNSPAGVAAFVAFLVWLINKIVAKKPALWAKYRGTILSAVKLAEKEIPDTSTNAGLLKLDWALKRIVEAVEKVEARKLTPPEIADLTEGISIVHDAAEEKETL